MQRYDALQGVEPNWLIFSVFMDSQRGQAIAGPVTPARRDARLASWPLAAVPSTGGAIPNARSLSRAESLIQSVVQAGDSLSSIAFDHGVTVDALMAANGLTDPDLVYMGQELVIPDDGGVPTTTAPPLVVTVEYGESLSIIAARHGVTVSAIMEENDLTDPDRIYVGQVLTIPNPVVPTTTAPPTTTLPSLVVTVEYGDSLSAIAGRYGVSVQAIVEANGITNPDRLSVGQSLVIPGVAPPVDPEAPSTDYGPVIVDGRLYLRDQHELHCYDIREI